MAINRGNNQKYYNSNSEKKNPKENVYGLKVKTIACLLGLLALVIIASTYRINIEKEEKAPYVTVQEVLPQLQAFSEVCGNNAYTNITSGDSFFSGEYVTLRDVKEVLRYFGDIDGSLVNDYKFDSWYVGLEDWNRILVQLVQEYGGNQIYSTELALIGKKEHILDEVGNAPEDGQVLTDKGMLESLYWNTDAYLYSNTIGVCYGTKLLSVLDYAKEPALLKNVYVADASTEEAHFFKNHYHIRYEQKKEDTPSYNKENPQEEKGAVNAVVIENTDTVTSGSLINLRLDKGVVTIEEKEVEYVHGKLLQVSDEGMEIEGHGVYEPDEEMEVYRLYGELATLDKTHLRIGYSFTDFVVENGKVAACLMIKEEDMHSIRVLLKNSNYEGNYHNSFSASCNQDFEVIYYENGREVKREEREKGACIFIERKDLEDGVDRVKLLPKVLSAKIIVDSLKRSQGIPEYFGSMEIVAQKEGLVLINEVLLEDYLCKVVPSEMPASYPKEALMAQAICARTYAYGKMMKSGLPNYGAHVDDSTGFQVYNNIKEQDSTTEAVKATHNRVALYQGEPISAYYYSTSSGVGADATIWHGTENSPGYLQAQVIEDASGQVIEDASGQVIEDASGQVIEDASGQVAEDASGRDFAEGDDGDIISALSEEENFRQWILNKDEDHYESEEGWYRWTYDVEKLDMEYMEEVLQSRYESNPGLVLTETESGEFESRQLPDLGIIEDIAVTGRLPGGVADELVITGSEATIKVLSELNIRYVLADGMTKALRQGKDRAGTASMLPSAYMFVDPVKEEGIITGYKITGGGFGHGVGMSQNGAKNMALLGKNCDEILTFFYPGIEIKTLQFKEKTE